MADKKYLIIGDVHGCKSELDELLKKTNYSPNTHELIFVGDLINKGPRSVEVLEYCYENNGKVVLGNHEWGFLKHVNGERFSERFEKIKTQMGSQLQFWTDYINSWPLFLEYPNFLVVHAGLEPNKHPSESSKKILCTIRTWDGKGENLNSEKDPAWYDFYHGDKLVIYGHWAIKRLNVRENTVGLDSGCCYGGELSAIEMPSRKIFQVSAKRNYV